mmetsp:Transcript_9330/g.19068  ORF Transcript_9330/g.19068 Transcript_9330/m.19068 type:complete len:135 (+) Transcript_9330:816-1220(+)
MSCLVDVMPVCTDLFLGSASKLLICSAGESSYCCMYSPHSAICFDLHLSLYKSFNCSITGAKTEMDLSEALTKLYPVLMEYRKANVAPMPGLEPAPPALPAATVGAIAAVGGPGGDASATGAEGIGEVREVEDV